MCNYFKFTYKLNTASVVFFFEILIYILSRGKKGFF